MTQYTILSVDNSRADLRANIEAAMEEMGFDQFYSMQVDGRIPEHLDAAMRYYDTFKVTGPNFHNGELGIWYATLAALDHIYTNDINGIVFEDDAVVLPPFKDIYPLVMGELPQDWDFFAWAIPDNQRYDYYYNRVFNGTGGWTLATNTWHAYRGSPHYIPGKELVCTAYQGYQAVCIMYSPGGADKIMKLAEEKGIYTPFDLFIFQESQMGNLNGYTLLPDVYPVVTFEERGTIARASGMYN